MNRGPRQWLAMAFTAMLAGRAMTLAFLPQVASGLPGAPPAAWLMPLVGDAVIGLTAPLILWLLWRRPSLGAGLVVVCWNVLGIWDALSAFLVHMSVPWPDFFMIQIFGSSMFFAASAMHGVLLVLAISSQPPIAEANPSTEGHAT